VDPYFTKKEEESKKRMNELGRKLALLYPPDGESAQKDNVTQKEDFETDDEFEVVNPFAPYVEITGVRFRFKWAGLDSLFRDAGNEREAYFAQMMNKLRENPDNSGMRASAIAFYWSLSRFVPGDSTTGYGFREINGEDIWSDDVSYWEPEPGWEDRRSEFRRFLQHIVEMRSPGRDWPSTKWEVINSFAADEWDRAYHQLRSAVQSSQAPQDAGEALILDCQFNSVFGKEMDLRLGLGMYRDEYFRNEKADLADIKHSLLVCREFDLSGLEQLPEQVCLDYDDRLPPQAFTKFIWNILRPTRSARPRNLNVSFQDLTTSFDSLGAIAPYYRSIRAQLAEFSGKIDYAASEYEALSKMELFGTNLAVDFTMRAAELYFEAGKNDKAAELASKATHSAPTDDERQSAYLLLAKAHAVSGNATAAHQALEHLDCETVQGDPLLRMLTTLSRSSDPALVQKRIDKWLFYARLTERSRELLRECAQFLHEAEVQHELRLRNLRIAAQEFAKAIEVELRNRVFEAFKQHVERRGKLDELAGHCCDDRALMGFMRGDVYGSQLGLGAMYRSMNSSRQPRSECLKSFSLFLQERHPRILRPDILQSLGTIVRCRNDEAHQLRNIEVGLLSKIEKMSCDVLSSLG
jgi:hypothetical protein